MDTSSLLTLDQHTSAEQIFISISGMIGAHACFVSGWHALTHCRFKVPAKAHSPLLFLAVRMGLPLFNEPVADNVYLADFYRDKARYAFPLQVRAA